MLEDFQEQQRKRMARMRSFMDYTMGSLLFLLGLFFLSYEKLGLNVFNRRHSTIDYLIGALFILYGIWRIYRGYKTDYFR
jgi:threonine/homoserine/homoserine lactone efflux protein